VNRLAEELAARIAGRVLPNEPLKEHTTWRIGGPADLLVEPASREDLKTILRFVREKGLPFTVIGNGSNLLVSDTGVRGVVVKIGERMGAISVAGLSITAGAGAKLGRVAAVAQEAGLGGLEFAVGIPATVGGAVTMNAGANGSTIGDLVETVTVVDYAGQEKVYDRAALAFKYRYSRLQQLEVIVVEVVLGLTPDDPEAIRRRSYEYLQKRRRTQPLEYPSAGSVFKNPPDDAAGRLIELAGAKGLRIGDAMVSEKHANFIVNLGAAKASDVLSLIERVREMVRAKFGITLELEVKILGDSGAG